MSSAVDRAYRLMIQEDKHLHFAARFFLYLFTWVAFLPWYGSLWVVLGIGGLKEAWDKENGTGFDVWDWVFTVAGGVLALLVLLKLGAVQ